MECQIRTAVRIRPMGEKELREGARVAATALPEERTIELGAGGHASSEKRSLVFDNVYGDKSTSGDVYEGSVAPLLLRALEGYNVTIFAYGQTGSGKTFTMMEGYENGAQDLTPHMGVAPRLMRDLFESLSGASGRTVDSWSVKVSCLEIYQEQVYDLLSKEGGAAAKNVIIRDNEAGEQVVSGLSEVEVSSVEAMCAALGRGMAARSTASTQMNARSSRSHAVFSITLEQTFTAAGPSMDAALSSSSSSGGAAAAAAAIPAEEDQQQQFQSRKVSRIHLVDLAGSERAAKTQAKGDRLREAASINKGLLALGNVINALAGLEDAAAAAAAATTSGDARGNAPQAGTHIPYRDSKLTRLLKSSLGGNAATLMIACASPADSNLEETLSTLRYASRARAIKNRAVVNTDSMTNQMGALRRQVKDLEAALLLAQAGGRGGGGALLPPLCVSSASATTEGGEHVFDCVCGRCVRLSCAHASTAARGGDSSSNSGPASSSQVLPLTENNTAHSSSGASTNFNLGNGGMHDLARRVLAAEETSRALREDNAALQRTIGDLTAAWEANAEELCRADELREAFECLAGAARAALAHSSADGDAATSTSGASPTSTSVVHLAELRLAMESIDGLLLAREASAASSASNTGTGSSSAHAPSSGAVGSTAAAKPADWQAIDLGLDEIVALNPHPMMLTTVGSNINGVYGVNSSGAHTSVEASDSSSSTFSAAKSSSCALPPPYHASSSSAGPTDSSFNLKRRRGGVAASTASVPTASSSSSFSSSSSAAPYSAMAEETAVAGEQQHILSADAAVTAAAAAPSTSVAAAAPSAAATVEDVVARQVYMQQFSAVSSQIRDAEAELVELRKARSALERDLRFTASALEKATADREAALCELRLRAESPPAGRPSHEASSAAASASDSSGGGGGSSSSEEEEALRAKVAEQEARIRSLNAKAAQLSAMLTSRKQSGRESALTEQVASLRDARIELSRRAKEEAARTAAERKALTSRLIQQERRSRQQELEIKKLQEAAARTALAGRVRAEQLAVAQRRLRELSHQQARRRAESDGAGALSFGGGGTSAGMMMSSLDAAAEGVQSALAHIGLAPAPYNHSLLLSRYAPGAAAAATSAAADDGLYTTLAAASASTKYLARPEGASRVPAELTHLLERGAKAGAVPSSLLHEGTSSAAASEDGDEGSGSSSGVISGRVSVGGLVDATASVAAAARMGDDGLVSLLACFATGKDTLPSSSSSSNGGTSSSVGGEDVARLRRQLEAEITAAVALTRSQALLRRLTTERSRVVARMNAAAANAHAPSSGGPEYASLQQQAAVLSLQISTVGDVMVALEAQVYADADAAAASSSSTSTSSRSTRSSTATGWEALLKNHTVARRGVRWLLSTSIALAETCDAAVGSLTAERRKHREAAAGALANSATERARHLDAEAALRADMRELERQLLSAAAGGPHSSSSTVSAEAAAVGVGADTMLVDRAQAALRAATAAEGAAASATRRAAALEEDLRGKAEALARAQASLRSLQSAISGHALAGCRLLAEQAKRGGVAAAAEGSSSGVSVLPAASSSSSSITTSVPAPAAASSSTARVQHSSSGSSRLAPHTHPSTAAADDDEEGNAEEEEVEEDGGDGDSAALDNSSDDDYSVDGGGRAQSRGGAGKKRQRGGGGAPGRKGVNAPRHRTSASSAGAGADAPDAPTAVAAAAAAAKRARGTSASSAAAGRSKAASQKASPSLDDVAEEPTTDTDASSSSVAAAAVTTDAAGGVEAAPKRRRGAIASSTTTTAAASRLSSALDDGIARGSSMPPPPQPCSAASTADGTDTAAPVDEFAVPAPPTRCKCRSKGACGTNSCGCRKGTKGCDDECGCDAAVCRNRGEDSSSAGNAPSSAAPGAAAAARSTSSEAYTAVQQLSSSSSSTSSSSSAFTFTEDEFGLGVPSAAAAATVSKSSSREAALLPVGGVGNKRPLAAASAMLPPTSVASSSSSAISTSSAPSRGAASTAGSSSSATPAAATSAPVAGSKRPFSSLSTNGTVASSANGSGAPLVKKSWQVQLPPAAPLTATAAFADASAAVAAAAAAMIHSQPEKRVKISGSSSNDHHSSSTAAALLDAAADASVAAASEPVAGGSATAGGVAVNIPSYLRPTSASVAHRATTTAESVLKKQTMAASAAADGKAGSNSSSFPGSRSAAGAPSGRLSIITPAAAASAVAATGAAAAPASRPSFIRASGSSQRVDMPR